MLRKCCIYTFIALQNSTSVKEFSQNIKHAYNIFNLKLSCKPCINSIQSIKKELIKKNLLHEFNYKNITEKVDEKKAKKSANIVINGTFKYKSLRKHSPFAKHFNKLINWHKKNVYHKTIKSKKNVFSLNFFYCPQIFQIFFKYLHIMPLWTGVMISQWLILNPNYSEVLDFLPRLTNNPVENWFGQLKNSLFPSKPIMPSEYANTMFATIEAEYEQHYASIKKTKLKNYKNFYKESEEQWKKSRNKFPKRIKGYYTQNVEDNLFEFNIENQSNDKKTNCRIT